MHEAIFIRTSNGVFTKVDSAEIVLLEASTGCVKILTTKAHYLVNSTLQQLEEMLPKAHFCRVNRSCIVCMDHVSGFTMETVFISDKELALGKGYAARFFERVKVVL
ncbi:LytR/AlgR family response regulator transcription factor [Chitinophaga silvisoli]|uniref:LytTR family transcriptional regulator n=1 Tax=Chitinophaga silvisoli TaxID=2291814 RepID=A0A3E1NYZ5_9BACT|nr:LytTR family DNA-binding domain-containing protein [Chitinophaga silvisoli]RFM33161.1 LytTR family transcriptional regulator [Chitinophaga silvisoli]